MRDTIRMQAISGLVTGMHMTFLNGWTLSVQQGRANYNGEHTVEIMGWYDLSRDGGDGIQSRDWPINGGQPLGWQTATELAEIIERVRNWCHCGADFNGSDHCPECGCEEFEAIRCQ